MSTMKQNGKAGAAPHKVPNAEHPYPLFTASRQSGWDGSSNRDSTAIGLSDELSSTSYDYLMLALP